MMTVLIGSSVCGYENEDELIGKRRFGCVPKVHTERGCLNSVGTLSRAVGYSDQYRVYANVIVIWLCRMLTCEAAK